MLVYFCQYAERLGRSWNGNMKKKKPGLSINSIFQAYHKSQSFTLIFHQKIFPKLL